MRQIKLLIDGNGDLLWKQILGEFEEIKTTDELTELPDLENYALIIIDATRNRHIIPLISKILTLQPMAKVVVMAASPDWRQARAVFQAGAQDYLSKSLPFKELHATLESILHKGNNHDDHHSPRR